MSMSFRALLAILLCTCAPPQDNPPDPDDEMASVRRAEELFTEAYENLDAAIIERLLSDDFILRHPGQGRAIDREAFLREVAEMGTLFPSLELRVDSVTVDTSGVGLRSSGRRTFLWRMGEQEGSFEERYQHYWRRDGAQYRLDSAIVQSSLAG